MEGEITKLPGFVDFNFKFKTKTGSYILKISRPDFELEYILPFHNADAFLTLKAAGN